MTQQLIIFRQNILHVLQSKPALLSGIMAIVLAGGIGWYFMDLDLTIGNMGHRVAYSELALSILFTLLFGLFVATSVYKYLYFRDLQTASVTTGSLGGLMGLLVAGCPACSITLASRLGLASLLGFLPYNGMELKLIAIGVLGYTLYILLRDLKICALTPKKGFTLGSIHMNKVLLGLVVAGGVAVSSWALRGYAQDQGLFTLPVVEAEQLADTQQVDLQAEPVVDTAYEPSTAPSGLCGGANGGCGCGG